MINWGVDDISNSSLVTGELFLDLEMALHKETVPSLQTILGLNEIVELVVLKNELLMTASDNILVLKTLNWDIISKLGGNDRVGWKYEIENLGDANLRNPFITENLSDKGILTIDTEEKADQRFRDFGAKIFSQQWGKKWINKNIGCGIKDPEAKSYYEFSWLKSFNDTVEYSSDPTYWLMAIKAAPDLAPKLEKINNNLNYIETYQFFKEVEIYMDYAKNNKMEFSDSPFMQPFIALNSQPTENFTQIFYKRLKKIRNEEIKDFLGLQDSWIYHLPPLTSILLDRCQKFDDIPDELLNLRKEFKNLRKDLTNFQMKFDNADTIRDKIDLKREFKESMNLFTNKAKRPKGRFIKTILDFAIEIPGSAIKKDFSGSINSITKSLAEYIYQRRIYPWVNSFSDLYGKSLEIREEKDLYENFFGKMNLKNFNEFQIFAKNSEKLVITR